MQAIVGNNAKYSKLVLKCGFRTNYRETDLSTILEDETMEATLKEAAEVSMGTEVADLDIINIQSLSEQVLSLTEYRAQLFEYLKNRMNAIAPNLTILVGELVGARLISHAGYLMNLAKQPASTVQILGAEKSLF
jgi:nucleolar protein 58